MIYAAWAFAIVGCVGTGAYLALQGHPWLGFFAMLVGACLEARSTTKK